MKRLRLPLACVAGLLFVSAASASVGANSNATQYGARPSVKDFSVSSFRNEALRAYTSHSDAFRGSSHSHSLRVEPAQQVGSVPEPSTWAMLLIGAALIVVKLRSHQPKKIRAYAGAM